MRVFSSYTITNRYWLIWYTKENKMLGGVNDSAGEIERILK